MRRSRCGTRHNWPGRTSNTMSSPRSTTRNTPSTTLVPPYGRMNIHTVAPNTQRDRPSGTSRHADSTVQRKRDGTHYNARHTHSASAGGGQGCDPVCTASHVPWTSSSTPWSTGPCGRPPTRRTASSMPHSRWRASEASPPSAVHNPRHTHTHTTPGTTPAILQRSGRHSHTPSPRIRTQRVTPTGSDATLTMTNWQRRCSRSRLRCDGTRPLACYLRQNIVHD